MKADYRAASQSVVLMALMGLLAVALLVPASGARGETPSGDPTRYCEGDGGPVGVASDLEHSVLVGDPPLPPGLRTSRVTVNGVGTRVQQAGPADATEAVVFVHGSPTSSRDWDDLVAANGRFARTVAFDIPGYGQSDKLARQVQTTNGAAAYIQGVLDQLGIRRAVLVGHDFGGIWGLQWAAQHPDALIGAVLIDGGVLIDYIPHPLAVVFATPIAGETQMASTTRESFTASLQSQNPRPLPAEYANRLYDDYDRAARCAILRYYRSSSETFQTLGRDQAAALRPLRRPALVIWGEKDPYIPPEQAFRQREAFPDARVEIFEDSGHFPFVDNADRTRGLVVPFLRPRLEARGPSATAGMRRLRVPVRVEGLLPAYVVRARLARVSRDGNPAGPVGDSGGPLTVSGAKTLNVQLRRTLRPGSYVLTVHARGLPTQRLPIRVAAAGSGRPGAGGAPSPRSGGRARCDSQRGTNGGKQQCGRVGGRDRVR